MDAYQIVCFACIGLGVGVLSGMLGIGGGVLIIPLLVMLLKFDQKLAVGTSLAMLLPPIGVFAVLKYYEAGQIHVPGAAIMAVLFAAGAYLGSHLVQHVPDRALRIFFCAFLLYVVGNMLFRAERRVWAALATLVLATGYGMSYVALRLFARRQERKWSIGKIYEQQVSQSLPLDYEI